MSIWNQIFTKKEDIMRKKYTDNVVRYEKEKEILPPKIKKNYRSRFFIIGDLRFYEVKPLNTMNEKSLTILAIHGGCDDFQLQKLNVVMLTEIIDKTKATIYIPIYPTGSQFYKDSNKQRNYICNLYEAIRKERPFSSFIMLLDTKMAPVCLSFLKYIREENVREPDEQIILSLPHLLYPIEQPLSTAKKEESSTKGRRKEMEQIIEMINQVQERVEKSC